MHISITLPHQPFDMTQRQYVILAVLVAIMALTAIGIGQWSVGLNPDGIVPHAPASGTAEPESTTPRSAFTFGASMGLLGAGLLYGMVAAGLLLHAKSRGLPARRFIYSVAGLAAAGFALSYLIDDYFY